MRMKQQLSALVERVRRAKPVRVFQWQADRNGQLLASGLSYQALFAVFASIWVGFAIAGAIIRANPGFERALLRQLSTSLPGLIDTGTGNGAIHPSQLLEAGILGWTGAIAAGALLFTALGWLAWGRQAVRAMFELPPPGTNFLLLKLKDLGLIVCFGVALLVSVALTVFSTTALGFGLDLIGVDGRSALAQWSTRILGLLVLLLFDAGVLAAFYRTVSGIRIPFRLLVRGALLGAIALGVLKVLGTSLLGGATRNPLLASFAVIIGLMIWFNLICQVIILAASWIAVSAKDAGIDLSERPRDAEDAKPPADTSRVIADDAAARRSPAL
jgi:membrane protein